MYWRKAFLIALLQFFSGISSAGTFIAGQVYDFSFSNVPFYELAPYQNQGGATINFKGDLLDLGDIVRLEFFENSTSDVAFFTNDFNRPTDSFGSTVTVPFPWQDLQGAIRITVLAGSINLDSISTQVIRHGSRYFETTYVSAVPEPSAIYLLVFGIIGMVLFLRKRGLLPNPAFESDAPKAARPSI